MRIGSRCAEAYGPRRARFKPRSATDKVGRFKPSPRVPGGGLQEEDAVGTNQDGRGVQLARESAGLFVAPTLVQIPNVEVVRETSTLLWCRVGGREFYVPREQLFGDEVRRLGDLGVLVVPDWFARDHGLCW